MALEAPKPAKPPSFRLNVSEPLSERLEMIRVISNRLCIALAVLLILLITGAYLVSAGSTMAIGGTSWMVLLTGILGGFIGLQRRLKELEHDDLLLLARSWVYVLLSPLVGGVLALLLFILFISGLVEGDLFPRFAADAATQGATANGLIKLIQIHALSYEEYAKLVFWCFLAGYSEKFVTNIISRFESTQPDGRGVANEGTRKSTDA